MADRSLSVGDIFRLFGDAYPEAHGASMPLHQHRALRAIRVCRTACPGGHILQCDACSEQWIVYNSCRNRHCPTCQGLATARWLAKQEEGLLPVPYFQVVFTLPDALHGIALRNQRVVYNILFRAAKETLLTLCRDPKYLGADIGFTAVLHTWNQQLLDHPHLHLPVPSGGICPDGSRWIPTRSAFFIAWPVISSLFRKKFLAYLKKAHEDDKLVFPGRIAHLEGARALKAHLAPLYDLEWVGYCRAPEGGPEHLLSYPGRYIHRVAISDSRILSVEGDEITFSYMDRDDGNKKKSLTVTAEEFIRRFLMHILPPGFVKIRHYGLLSNRQRRTKCARALMLIQRQGLARKTATTFRNLLDELTGSDAKRCPVCGKGRIVRVETLLPQPVRAPPDAGESAA